MNVSLTPELEKYVYEKLDGGFYSSVSEIIRESLRLMLRQESDLNKREITRLNRDIKVGLESLNDRKIPASESYQRLKNKIKNIYLNDSNE